jgi:hypothetical protein
MLDTLPALLSAPTDLQQACLLACVLACLLACLLACVRTCLLACCCPHLQGLTPRLHAMWVNPPHTHTPPTRLRSRAPTHPPTHSRTSAPNSLAHACTVLLTQLFAGADTPTGPPHQSVVGLLHQTQHAIRHAEPHTLAGKKLVVVALEQHRASCACMLDHQTPHLSLPTLPA